MLVGRPGASPEEDAAVRKAANDAVFAYFGEMVAKRDEPRADDVMPLLFSARYNDERPLTDDELLRLLWLLMVGGLHTVRGVLSFGDAALRAQPRAARRPGRGSRPRRVGGGGATADRLDGRPRPGRDDADHRPRRDARTRRHGAADVLGRRSERRGLRRSARDADRPHGQPTPGVQRRGAPLRGIAPGPDRDPEGAEEIHRRIRDYALAGDPAFHDSQVRGLESLPLRFTPA